jgi:hypothetical protein
LLRKQNWRCMICSKEQPKKAQSKKVRLKIDHDHRTGQVRGLLCHTCNAGLGMFKDNIELLHRAIMYLGQISHTSRIAHGGT